MIEYCRPIDIDLDEHSILHILKNHNRWIGWIWTDSGLVFGRKATDDAAYSAQLHKLWDKLDPYINLNGHEVDLTKSHASKLSAGCWLHTHVDIERRFAIIIPLGDNKGSIEFYEEVDSPKPIVVYPYKGPTLINAAVPHKITNNSDHTRYAIQLHCSQAYNNQLERI